MWGGYISIGFCLKRDKAKTAMREIEWSRGRGVERKRDQKMNMELSSEVDKEVKM